MRWKFFPLYALSIILITMHLFHLNTVFNFIYLLINAVFYMLDTYVHTPLTHPHPVTYLK